MAHVHQVTGWLDEFALFAKHDAWKRLNDDARFMVEAFIGQLMKAPTDKRANIISPFTSAVKAVLKRRNIEPDRSAASVTLGDDLKRTSDLSFTVDGKRWVFEIKTGLEFNSLGAAVLEAIAFKVHDPDCVFVLLSLYAKAIKGDLLDTIKFCQLKGMFDHAFILTRTADEADVYFDNVADNLNAFIDTLPDAR